MVRRRLRAGSTNLPLVQLLRGVKNRKSKNGNCFSFISFANRAEWSPGSEMSGGERKKRIARGTGWEEAGGEFFQESYPGAELDLEALPRDPHYFATLLPSKQTRAATTRKPSKVDNKATYRRRTSTRQRNTNTMAQNNTMPNNDIHVAMMPDLSENLANEETTWEEMMLIKAMPVSMAQKKEIKAKLLSADTFRLQGIRRLKWRRRKLWEYLKVRWKELHKKSEMWRRSFQTIEGRYGPAVTSLFVFIKWLMFLNLTVTAFIVAFIVVPTLLIKAEDEECLPSNTTTTSIACCSQLYDTNATFVLPSIFEVLQGTGWLERTHLFYGIYPHTVLQDNLISYNLPVAYMCTFIVVYVICFLAIIKGGSAGFKERLVEGEGQYYKFCSLIFSGWDFCLHSDKGASAKHKALFLEMKEWIEEERREDDKKNRTRDEFCRGMLVRISVHLLVKLIFAAASSLVYFTIQFNQSELQTWNYSEEYRLLLEYAPSFIIIGLNLVVPKIFHYLISLEGYTPVNTMRINLVRNLFLRFSLILVLLASIHSLVECGVGPDDTCVSRTCRTPLCWETFAAQQLYKLILLETVVQALIVFFANFPRMLLAKHVRCKLARVLGSQEFDLPKHLVDLVYMQFLVWLSSFFMPLIPAVATILLFCTFYLKKFSCLVNSLPPTKTVYRVSKSKSMYLLVLLGAFLSALGVLGFMAVTVQPSRSCGPFRGLSTYWSLVQITYGNFPEWFRNFVAISTSSTVAFPALILLVLLFYYYYTLTTENRQMVIVLKKQLVLEGHDKQFLLNRLSAFIKQHQERHKAARSIDPPPANSA